MRPALQLKEVEVKDFRPYEHALFQLRDNDVTIIAGANNSGKSSLLAALDLLSPASSQQFRRIGARDRARVTYRFAIDAAFRDRLLSGSQFADRWTTADGLDSLEVQFADLPGKPGLGIEGILVSARGRMIPVAILNWVTAGTSGSIRVLDLRAWLQAHGPDEEPVLRELVSGAVFGELGLSGTTVREALPDVFDALDSWRSSVYHFHALRPGTEAWRKLGATPHLLPSGENLPEVLLYYQTQRPKEWAMIRDFMEDALPEIGSIQTPAEAENVRIAFEDSSLGTRLNLKDLGTGVEQLLLTAVVGITHPQAGLVIIEEPETNLHPAAQRKLMSHMRVWARDKQFVVSTHSTVFIDQAASDAPVWLVERREGRSTLRDGGQDMPGVLAALGVRLSDVLSAEKILVVEGPSDVEIIQAFLMDSRDAGSIAIVSAGGGDAAWHLEESLEWIRAADSLERAVLFLRDRDELTADQVETLEASEHVCVLGRRELENYLLEESAIAAVIGSFGGLAPTPTEVGAQMRRCADAVQDEVVLKRTIGRLGSLRGLSRRDVRALCATQPGPELIWERLASNVSTFPKQGDVAAIWGSVLQDVREHWDERRFVDAPGSGVLDGVFRNFGQSYSKVRDGAAIARRVGDAVFQSMPRRLADFVSA